MHLPPTPTPNLLQLADKATHLAAGSKQSRAAAVFQTVSMVSVCVLGLAASAKLLRELFGHAHPGRGRG